MRVRIWGQAYSTPSAGSFICTALGTFCAKPSRHYGKPSFSVSLKWIVTELPFYVPLDREAESLSLNASTPTYKGANLGKVAFLSFSVLRMGIIITTLQRCVKELRKGSEHCRHLIDSSFFSLLFLLFSHLFLLLDKAKFHHF